MQTLIGEYFKERINILMKLLWMVLKNSRSHNV